mmetsp:Transcript_58666/g.126081  ORF Transcript_58666/g.126081 Transcript_58666/m.126081 type:complete len:256 (-) Transcript_58666:168-935(-)
MSLVRAYPRSKTSCRQGRSLGRRPVCSSHQTAASSRKFHCYRAQVPGPLSRRPAYTQPPSRRQSCKWCCPLKCSQASMRTDKRRHEPRSSGNSRSRPAKAPTSASKSSESKWAPSTFRASMSSGLWAYNQRGRLVGKRRPMRALPGNRRAPCLKAPCLRRKRLQGKWPRTNYLSGTSSGRSIHSPRRKRSGMKLVRAGLHGKCRCCHALVPDWRCKAFPSTRRRMGLEPPSCKPEMRPTGSSPRRTVWCNHCRGS